MGTRSHTLQRLERGISDDCRYTNPFGTSNEAGGVASRMSLEILTVPFPGALVLLLTVMS
jgi:hypothetical protein